MMFQENKYKKWYFSIVDRANIFNRIKGDIYYESHHIIPKSLGGSNIKSNKVLLTAKEHFVCHLLLPKMVNNKQHIYKMKWALHRMGFSNNRKLTGLEYDYVRKIHSQNLIENHPSKTDPNWSEKHSKRIKNSYANNQLRELRSLKFKETWANMSNEIKDKIGKASGQRTKDRYTGTSRPECGRPQPTGSNNRMAVKIVVEAANGEIFYADCIKTFCEQMELNYDCMLQVSRGKAKQHRGFKIIAKGESVNAYSSYN